MESVNLFAIRRRLPRTEWRAPIPVRGTPGQWQFSRKGPDGTIAGALIVSVIDVEGPEGVTPWLHASISWLHRMPDYEDLKLMHRAVFGEAPAYQIFVPPEQHVNISPFVLHLWGRSDGRPALPDMRTWVNGRWEI